MTFDILTLFKANIVDVCCRVVSHGSAVIIAPSPTKDDYSTGSCDTTERRSHDPASEG